MQRTHRQRQESSLRLRNKEPYTCKTKEPYTSAKRAQWARKRALCVCKRPMKCTNRLKLESGLCLRDKSPVNRAKRALCVCKRALWPQKSPVFLHQTCEKKHTVKDNGLSLRLHNKEPSIYMAKEPYESAKEPYISAKNQWKAHTVRDKSLACDCVIKSPRLDRLFLKRSFPRKLANGSANTQSSS